jgi:hypothetical protein
MYRLTLIVLVIIILGGYLYFSKPDTVVINESGKIEGLTNKARALIQRNKFWRFQLKMANERYNKSLEPHMTSTSDMRELYQRLRDDEKALDGVMKELYTPEEQMARSLRIKADSLEREGKWRLVDENDEKIRMNEIEKFKIIIPIIESKLNIPKP